MHFQCHTKLVCLLAHFCLLLFTWLKSKSLIMSKYKFHYFDARGIAEPGRIMFAAAGVEYEDIRFSFEEWPALKDNYRFKQVPVLEFDGKQYGQSLAIFGYLAREFGFYGKTSLDQLNIDMVIQILIELYPPDDEIFLEKDPEKKAALTKKFVEDIVPKQLDKFEKLLKENGTGYFVGSELTMADMFVYSFVSDIQRKDPNAIENYPEIKRLFANVLSNERINNYIKTRRDTEF